jgi:hypothetical protein
LVEVARPGLANVGPSVAARGTDPPTVDCETRAQVIPAKDHPARIRPSVRRRSIVAGRVLFLGAKQWSNYPEESKPGIRIPVKVPMVAEAGAAVTISLTPEQAGQALIGVARDQKPYEVRSTEVRLEPCQPDATVANRRVGRRTPFVGGFRLHGPTCLGLTVRADDDPQPIAREIAFGQGCGEG